ncbi:MAG TPA: 2-hydroxychromene-2-carboxylate isomerase [Tahibacter sp.]|uniref:2-hydroxychromene-2-carboxylate isomerase n=1 Tax=Tahibacter sp. TaxID=2056211 RepID=UPI002C0B57CE|nr:2-hydroxychromene-2-carboxylate isomerase [Tahibacter sp.]HSX58976.1 2-hydroxychromene-2-carboxylate isomerase [Tahibacter sp.]
MHVQWYFDFISPFAWLQLHRLSALRERATVEPVPILFAAVLDTLGQLGPAEIPGKRDFTYRFVQWRAERQRIPLRFPPAHPFNPLTALRLSIAAGTRWDAVERVFAHIWEHGRAADSIDALRDTAAALGIGDVETALAADHVKQQLRANTEQALADGVFGVPTLRIGEALFWGEDATAMALEHLDDPQRFERGEYARIATLPQAVQRRR